VFAFFGFGQGAGELAKIGGGHGGLQVSDLGLRIRYREPRSDTNLQSAI
jgi:hypothetical protein